MLSSLNGLPNEHRPGSSNRPRRSVLHSLLQQSTPGCQSRLETASQTTIQGAELTTQPCRTRGRGFFARPLLQSSLALPGAPASARLDLGRSYLALDRPDDALPHLQSSVGLDTDGSIHYQLAQALQRLGTRDEAREALAQYQALDARVRQQTEAGAALDITPPQ